MLQGTVPSPHLGPGPLAVVGRMGGQDPLRFHGRRDLVWPASCPFRAVVKWGEWYFPCRVLVRGPDAECELLSAG